MAASIRITIHGALDFQFWQLSGHQRPSPFQCLSSLMLSSSSAVWKANLRPYNSAS